MKYVIRACEVNYLQGRTIEAESEQEAKNKYEDEVLQGRIMIERSEIKNFVITKE